MLIVEVIVTVLVVVALAAAFLAWLTRPLWRAAARRWRAEAEADRMRAERERHLQELRGRAALEVETWLGEPVKGLMDREGAGLAAAADPVLRAVLERYPMDERVMELARVYRQATGQELLPRRLREATEPAGEDAEAGSGGRLLTDEEARVLAEAAREVEGWISSPEGSGGARGDREKG